MTVNRANAATLIKKGLPYTIVSNETVHSIKDLDCLGVWCYLQTKPENWVIYKKEVANHFNVGRDKMSNIFKKLENLGLITVNQSRNEDGQFSKNQFVLHHSIYFPNDPVTENKLMDPHTERLSTENRTLQSINDNKEINTHTQAEKNFKTEVLKRHPLGEDWKPNDTHVKVAQEMGIEDFELEKEKFKDWAVGREEYCWQASFRNWLRKYKKSLNGQTRSSKHGHYKRKLEPWELREQELQDIARNHSAKKRGHPEGFCKDGSYVPGNVVTALWDV